MARSLLAFPLSITAVFGSPSVIAASPGQTPAAAAPIVIAHRGASGYRPEHTLAAYELAIAMGADSIEPDLVMTKDGQLIARHENALAIVDARTGETTEATTNVHVLPQFASRRATKTVDGKLITGWFAEDFTLAEIKTLRARERIPRLRPANTAYDDQHTIPTLQEIIALAKAKSAALGRSIGIYPETKHPSYHAAIGLPLEDALVKVLADHGWNDAQAPVYIQSFETHNLRYLATITRVRLVQLLDSGGQPWDLAIRGDPRTYADLASATGLREIATYAQGVGPHKNLVIRRSVTGRLGKPTALVRDAHAAGLVVHPWTFRAENNFLPAQHRRGSDPAGRGDSAGEIAAFLATGIDGFFTDHADVGAAAVSGMKRQAR